MVSFSLRKMVSASAALCVVAAGVIVPTLTIPEAFVASAATGDLTSTLNVSVTSVNNKPVDGAEVSVTCSLPAGGGDGSDDFDIPWESFVSTASIGASNSAQDVTKNGVATFTEVPEGANCTVTVKSCGEPVSQTVAIAPGETNLPVQLSCEVDSSSSGATDGQDAPIPSDPKGTLTINARTPRGVPVPNIPFSVTCEAKPSNDGGGSQPPVQPTPPSDPSDGSGGTGTDNGDNSDDDALEWQAFVSTAAIGADKTADVVTEDNGSVKVTDIPVGENGHTCTVVPKDIPGNCEITPPQETVDILTTALEATADFTLTCKNPVSLVKVDAEDAQIKLEGFRFKLAAQDGTAQEATSTSTGEVRFAPVVGGTYTLTEIAAPEASAYELATEPVTIEVSELPNMPKEYGNFANKRKTGSVDLVKVSAIDAEKKLKGVEFTLTPKNGGQAIIKQSDAEGLVHFDGLAWGEYTLQESQTIDGYKLDNSPRDIVINAEHLTHDLGKITNEPLRGSLVVKKIDSTKPDKVLSGADFQLFAADNTPVGEAKTTDATGKVTFDNLLFGKYILRETAAPEGYVIISDTLDITIDQADVPVEMTVGNDPKPEEPNDPVAPVDPQDPGQPSEPEKPADPDKPSDPEKPADPVVPTPGKETSKTPATEKENNPAPKSVLAQTGANAVGGLVAFFAAVGASLLVIRRRQH